jgi:deoxyribose-phosphate aldolase
VPARQSRLHTPGATVSVLEARALARTVDISCVRAAHTEQDVRRLAAEATRWEFINAHVLPSWVPLLRELLEGTRTLVGSPVGFPSGGASTASKVAEARHLLVDGVQEMDVVMNIGRFLSGDIRYVTTELQIIVGEVRGKVPVKVIIETSLLTEPQIRNASELAAAAGADFVKTGTGWAGPATAEAVLAIAESIPPHVQIKAAGGIRTLAQLQLLQAAGATRFGVGAHAALDLIHEAEGGEAP